MAELDFDYARARADGYSDLDILRGLQSAGKLNFDLDRALKDRHDPSEILQTIYQPKTPEPAPEPSSLLRRAGDVGLSLLKGAVALPEAAIGLADIVTGGAAGRGAEAIGLRTREAKEQLDYLMSPEQQAANRRVQEAEGFLGTAGAMLQNPSTILHTAAESAPSMLAGGGIGRAVTTLAPRVGAIAAGAIGEGAVGAGLTAEQIRQQSGGDLSLGQSAAALASGIGTGIFGALGGRIANSKLGQRFGISDVDTSLAGGLARSSDEPAVAAWKRIIASGVSEGVFEELPQTIQEQMWQNAAMDRPLLEGVPENAAQGLIAGGLFGGVAGAALPGRQPDAPAADPVTGETPLLPYKPDPFISFPDGSVGRQSDADAFIAALPEDQRLEARARLFGMEPQPINPEDILQAQSVDDAISLATRAIEEGSPEFRQMRNTEIDAAWNQHLGQRAAVRTQEFELARAQRAAAEEAAMQQQLADQAVEQAAILTEAQGFDQPEPTAMQLAMQRAGVAPQEEMNAIPTIPATSLPAGSGAGLEVPTVIEPVSEAGRADAAQLAEDLRPDGAVSAAAGGLPAGGGVYGGTGARGSVDPLTRVTGRQMDNDWTEFSPDAKSMNVPRAEMPQIKAEHRGAMTQFLGARGISHETMEVPADSLKPTQQEFSQAKVQAAREFTDGDRSILVSSDNRILDGHHQWLAKLEAGEPVKVIRLNAPIKQLLREVHEFPSARTDTGAAPQTAPQNIPETIPADAAPDVEDDGADIPVGFMKRVKVPHDVFVQDENQYETVDMPADKALAAVREDIADYRALLNCLRS
jgi:hypothetical protein